MARSGGDLDADLAEPGSAERVVAEAVGKLGGLDILISNVGTNVRTTTVDYAQSDYEKVFATNLTGRVGAVPRRLRASEVVGRRLAS